MCDVAGYAELAERRCAGLGRVRRVWSGPGGGLVLADAVAVDGDGASRGKTALAAYDAASYYTGGADPDEDYAVAQAGSGPEQCGCDWHKGSGAVLEQALRRLAAVETLAASLAMQVSALQTDLLATQTANAYLEHRLSEMQRAADAQEGEL